MPTNPTPRPAPPPPAALQISPAAAHISAVRSALRAATGSATELGDLLSAALTADDQQRRVVTGGPIPTPPASDSNNSVDSGDQ